MITAASRIERVVVHARGALVSRAVSVPADLPAGQVDLVIAGLTLFAEPGSLRAALRAGGRTVVFAQMGLHVPATTALQAPSVERVAELDRRIERRRAEVGALERRREVLAQLAPEMSTRSMLLGQELGVRVRDGLAVARLAREIIASIDERLLGLQALIEKLELERRAAALEDAQVGAEARRGQGQPSRQVTVRLAGEGPVDELALIYAVPAARWWPASTLRLSEGGTRAAWELEAVVAQSSGEDWSGVRLGFSTAQMLFDARLPELASLRFGRAQPRKPTGYRGPPPGLTSLFAEFDRAFPGGMPGLPPPLPPLQAPPSPPLAVIAKYEDEPDDLAAELPAGALASFAEEPAPMMAAEAPPPPPQYSGKAMARARPAAAPMRAAMMMSAPAAGGGPGGPPRAPPPPRPPEPTEVEPASGWLDFDALELAGPEDQPRRGKLARTATDPAAQARAAAELRIERLQPGPLLREPLPVRGQFDHRYDAAAAVDVPGDGLPHRVPIASASGQPQLRLRTVPRESAQVYREAELANPFSAPLLGGPVDVYVEGTLLTTTSIDGIDRGGRFSVGMGVEDRLRVARNARTDEGSAGLLGGSTAVTQSISIELSSSLGVNVSVEVIDRVPVSDSDDIKVERLETRPPAEVYSQAAAGRPVRGGLIWKVAVPAGGKAVVEHRYRITLPAKDELVGGNRRE